MGAIQLIGSTMGLSFVAGLRLYATILALGLAIRFHWFVPGGGQEALLVLAHPAVLVSAGVAYFAEFFADKIPWIDSMWDTVHSVIRPLGAAVLAAAALGHMNPALKLTLIILSGSVALASHSSKAATRLVVNQSPEPFTNIGLSLLGDTLAPLGIWLSLAHPLSSCFSFSFSWASSPGWRPRFTGQCGVRLYGPRAWVTAQAARRHCGNRPVEELPVRDSRAKRDRKVRSRPCRPQRKTSAGHTCRQSGRRPAAASALPCRATNRPHSRSGGEAPRSQCHRPRPWWS